MEAWKERLQEAYQKDYSNLDSLQGKGSRAAYCKACKGRQELLRDRLNIKGHLWSC